MTLWYHIYVHDNYVYVFTETIVKILCALKLFMQDACPLILKIKQIAFFLEEKETFFAVTIC